MLRRLLLTLAFIASSALAQQPDNNTYPISGTVVNSVTGAPVPHALVMASGMTTASVLTSRDGHFEFPALPAGKYVLSARRPGFFTENEITHRGPFGVIAVAGPDAVSATVTLVPEAVISGHVQDENDEPVAGIRVSATQTGIRDGRKYFDTSGNTSTNRNGDFRIVGLRPGAYYISVDGTEYQYGETAAMLAAASGSNETLAAFPMRLYYPSSRSIAEATLFQVRAGQHLEIRFPVRHEPAYRITATFPAGLQGVNFSLEQVPAEFTWAVDMPVTFNTTTGILRASVVAGTYELHGNLQDAGGNLLNTSAPLTVSSDMNLRLTFNRTASVPVHVRNQFSIDRAQLDPPLYVSLSQPGKLQAWTSDYQANLRIPNVPPGTYRASFHPNGNYYVASATWSGADLLHEPMVIRGGGDLDAIEVVLRDDVALLTATVRGAAPGTAPFVFVAPADGGPPLDIPILYGNMTMPNPPGLPPGDYYVWALESRDAIEWRNPDVLEKLRSKAAHVTLSPGVKSTVTLDVVRSSDE